MSPNDETSDHDEMSDRQLDLLLTTANEELLEHIQAAADPGRTLTAIMAINAPVRNREAPPALVVLAICVRRKAHGLARNLGFDRDRTCGFYRDLDRGIPDAPDRAVARGRDLCRTLGFARDVALGLVHDLARDPDLDTAQALNADLHGDLELILYRVQALARVLDRDRDLASEVLRAFDSDLDRAYAKACDLDHNLQMQPVDASGADLSDLEIEDVEVLNGIIWTHETTWPSNIAGPVHARSEEVQPGVYQIRIGGRAPEHFNLAPV